MTMRTISTILTCLVLSFYGQAQQDYFLSIRSDDQPFYVRSGDKTWSSNAIGFLVIPALKDSTYRFTIGFPRNKYPEQYFTISFNRHDLGFQLNQSDKGWQLENWQTGDKLGSHREEAADQGLLYGEKKKDDAFAALMAGVVSDSAVTYTIPVKKVEKEVLAVQKDTVRTDPTSVAGTTATVTSEAKAIDTVMVKAEAPSKPVTHNDNNNGDSSVNAVHPETKANADSIAIAKVDTVEKAVVGPVAKKKAKKKEEPAQAAATDSTNTVQSVVSSEVNGKSEIPALPVISVVKLQETVSKTAKTLVYTDSNAGGIDTVSVVIELDADPLPAKTVVEGAKKESSKDTLKATRNSKDTAIGKPVEDNKQPAPKKDSAVKSTEENKRPESKKDTAKAKQEQTAEQAVKKETAKKDDRSETPVVPVIKQEGTTPKPQTDLSPVKPAVVGETAGAEMPVQEKNGQDKKLVLMNSDCVNFASESDVDRLRLKIMGETNLDGRLNTARKVLRTRCITTKQVRALSELFMNDDERFHFFELAYPFTADTGNFRQLIDLLSDNEAIGKFKKLVRM